MAHKSAQELKELISKAKSQVEIGGTYYHYKHPEQFYTLIDVVVIEATDTPGVLYRAEYPDIEGVVFLRPIEDFLAMIEVNGKKTPRFTLIRK